MIQKEKTANDPKFFIITNASHSEALSKLNNTESWNPIKSRYDEISFFKSIESLQEYLQVEGSSIRNGNVIFMFFDNLEFIEKTLESLLNLNQMQRNVPFVYSMKSIVKMPQNFDGQANQDWMNNSHGINYLKQMKINFYIDKSVYANGNEDFCSIATLASSVLNKSSELCSHRRLYIDDLQLNGPKHQPLTCLIRNFPEVDLKLSSGVF